MVENARTWSLRKRGAAGVTAPLLILAACSNAPSYRVTVNETGAALTLAESNPDHSVTSETSDDERHRCGELFSVDASSFVTVSGNQSTVELDATDLLAVKIAGNQNHVAVRIESVTATTSAENTEEQTPPAGFGGLCFLLSGNQARATVDIVNFALGKFAYVGRGNQPAVTLTVGEDASVGDIQVDLNGNQGTLSVTGDGDYECPDAQHGANSAIACASDAH